MSSKIDIRDLPGRMEELLALAAAGQEVILYDGPVARARLTPMVPRKERVAGLHLGAVTIAPDFDSPIPEGFWLGQE